MKLRCLQNSLSLSYADPEGRTGGPDNLPPEKKHKNIVFLSNSDPDPLKITKALPSQHSMFGHHRHASELGHHRHASEKPFKWRFAGGPMIALL